MTAQGTRLLAHGSQVLYCALLLHATACDEPRPTAQPEPAASAPTAVPAAALDPPALRASASPSAVPASGGAPSATSAPTSTSSAQAPRPSANTDPNNPCATRYEERVGEDGKVTRVLIPKDKRCGQRREGGISPRGDVYGY
jgi:hypothetical protein